MSNKGQGGVSGWAGKRDSQAGSRLLKDDGMASKVLSRKKAWEESRCRVSKFL